MNVEPIYAILSRGMENETPDGASCLVAFISLVASAALAFAILVFIAIALDLDLSRRCVLFP